MGLFFPVNTHTINNIGIDMISMMNKGITVNRFSGFMSLVLCSI